MNLKQMKQALTSDHYAFLKENPHLGKKYFSDWAWRQSRIRNGKRRL